jgi:hypothetical protein
MDNDGWRLAISRWLILPGGESKEGKKFMNFQYPTELKYL